MLLEENRSITDVCYSCGFNDLSYFIHVFKKYKGMSPKAYVKKINLQGNSNKTDCDIGNVKRMRSILNFPHSLQQGTINLAKNVQSKIS